SCLDDTDGDGIANESGTPVCPERVDFANTDVETRWATQGPAGAPTWNRTPTAPGYGLNPNVSRGAAGQQGEPNLLESLAVDGDGVIEPGEALNTNVESPDAHTVFDTTIAFSPVALIANRGLDIDHLSYTQLQYAFVTGRLPDGFNPAVAVRDVGSGTRNAW